MTVDAAALCSQPTLSRLVNTPGPRALIRMARAMAPLSRRPEKVRIRFPPLLHVFLSSCKLAAASAL